MSKKPMEKSFELFKEISKLIEQSKKYVAITVNSAMTELYWHIGEKLKKEILQNKRAKYGEQIIATISQKLTEKYGKGWSEKQLRHCLHFVEIFPDLKTVSTLWRELTWSHIKELIYINDSLKRNFYLEMCKLEKWSVRTLRDRINSMLYERTAISKKPEETIKSDLKLLKNREILSPDLVFRDPYFLDFLGLSDKYSEKDLESAILVELQNFIIELGSDFAFLSRQKRITIDNEDYYIDLLFYHRRLKRLVAIELKLGRFKASYKGQMELYLRWLEKFEMLKDEKEPIGLILCASKNEEHIELLQLDNSNIRVAEYLTKLPDFKILENKLKQSIERAKNKLLLKEDKNE